MRLVAGGLSIAAGTQRSHFQPMPRWDTARRDVCSRQVILSNSANGAVQQRVDCGPVAVNDGWPAATL